MNKDERKIKKKEKRRTIFDGYFRLRDETVVGGWGLICTREIVSVIF